MPRSPEFPIHLGDIESLIARVLLAVIFHSQNSKPSLFQAKAELMQFNKYELPFIFD